MQISNYLAQELRIIKLLNGSLSVSGIRILYHFRKLLLSWEVFSKWSLTSRLLTSSSSVMSHYDAAPSHCQEYCQSFQDYPIMTSAFSSFAEVSRCNSRLGFHFHFGFPQTGKEWTLHFSSFCSLKYCRSKPSNNELCEEYRAILNIAPSYTMLFLPRTLFSLSANGLLEHMRIYSGGTFYKDLGSKISE